MAFVRRVIKRLIYLLTYLDEAVLSVLSEVTVECVGPCRLWSVFIERVLFLGYSDEVVNAFSIIIIIKSIYIAQSR